jgi:hypothetical protein
LVDPDAKGKYDGAANNALDYRGPSAQAESRHCAEVAWSTKVDTVGMALTKGPHVSEHTVVL